MRLAPVCRMGTDETPMFWLALVIHHSCCFGCWLRMLLDAAAVKGHWPSTGQTKSHAPHPQPGEGEVLVPVARGWLVGDGNGGISAGGGGPCSGVSVAWSGGVGRVSAAAAGAAHRCASLAAAAAAAAARSACCRATLAALFAFICSNAGSCCKHHNATRNVGCC